MILSNITIFYSWQSDLPRNETKNFIQSCINAAVKSLRGTAYIEADRDTKGEFGSPDISQVIFDKIENSDIFIADVSIVNSDNFVENGDGEFVKTKRLSPNPNVLTELGFAVGILGWDNVICIMDEDYGEASNLPFDLEHRRITRYSLKNNDKAEIKKGIIDIISSTVTNLLKNGTRVKKGMAAFKVGSYVNGNISDELFPYDPFNSKFLSSKINECVDYCKTLISEISDIKLISENSESKNENPFENITKSGLMRYKEENKEFYKYIVSKYLNIQLPNDFFEMGSLKIQISTISGKTEYFGNEEEKTKLKKMNELQWQLYLLHMLNSYWKTYKKMLILPLAIDNISSISDSEITIFIKVEQNSAEIINPDRNILAEELKGMEGFIYEDAFLKDILMMPSNNDISYDVDISYNINDHFASMKHLRFSPFNKSYPKYDASDYEREIKKYFATSMENSNDTYEFNIRGLRAHEKLWLGSAILIRPLKDEVVLSYIVKSKNSDGLINGTLKYSTNNR